MLEIKAKEPEQIGCLCEVSVVTLLILTDTNQGMWSPGKLK